MERRRQLFVENGFFIRRLNQAYFAFYGAYAETPGGPAGEDPVGPAVRALRAGSPSLAAFVNRISWMTSFQQLKRPLDNSSMTRIHPLIGFSAVVGLGILAACSPAAAKPTPTAQPPRRPHLRSESGL